MKKDRLGCLSINALIAFLISIIFVAIFYVFNGLAMFSPGDLTANNSGEILGEVSSHFNISKDCEVCHAPPFSKSGMSELCLKCHSTSLDDFNNVNHAHGVVEHNYLSIECYLCHTDHKGQNEKISFFPEGVSVNHEKTGFNLSAHSQAGLNCTDCHFDNFSSFKVFICQECHQTDYPLAIDKHIQFFGTECLECHDGVDIYGKSFDHDDLEFKLSGQHLEIDCIDCHLNARNKEDLRITANKCNDCHSKDDVHLRNMGTKCEDCHSSLNWKNAVYDHIDTGWILDGKHKNLICLACHVDTTYLGASRACDSCHIEEDAHEGVYGQNCEICHITDDWKIANFNHLLAISENCQNCHSIESPDLHYSGQCSACHIIESWLPATFDHAVAEATNCLDCHASVLPSGHFAGQCSNCHYTTVWKPSFFSHSLSWATNCSACHNNVLPQNHFSGQCSACHGTNAWKPANFNHTFPLNHEGANNDCSLCHQTENYQSYTCYGCHEHTPANIEEEHTEEGITNYSNCMECHSDGKEPDDD